MKFYALIELSKKLYGRWFDTEDDEDMDSLNEFIQTNTPVLFVDYQTLVDGDVEFMGQEVDPDDVTFA